MDELESLTTAKRPFSDTLEMAREKSVPMMVNVVGGGRYSGRIKDHSADAIVLWRVVGKDNFDVYIPLQNITCIEFEVRVGK